MKTYIPLEGVRACVCVCVCVRRSCAVEIHSSVYCSRRPQPPPTPTPTPTPTHAPQNVPEGESQTRRRTWTGGREEREGTTERDGHAMPNTGPVFGMASCCSRRLVVVIYSALCLFRNLVAVSVSLSLPLPVVCALHWLACSPEMRHWNERPCQATTQSMTGQDRA